jgi:hypothetical protein
MSIRCKPGDLAVVINAKNRCNLGHIVRIIAPHDDSGDIVLWDDSNVWLVEAASPLTWSEGKKRFRRKLGPAPDNQLQPIRGLPTMEKNEEEEVLVAEVLELLEKLRKLEESNAV